MLIYGYARVSSKEQRLDRQIEALKKIKPDVIYHDKASGKDFERKNFLRLVKRLKFGDVVYVESLDRFGRNYREIIEWWKFITGKGADIVVLDMPLLDTRKSDENNLLGSVITDIVLSLLSYVAETERRMIKERQKEGIECAMKRGVKFGAPKRVTVGEQETKVLELVNEGVVTRREAAEKLKLTYSQVVYREKLVRQLKQ